MNEMIQFMISGLLKATQPLLNAPGLPEIMRRRLVNGVIQTLFNGDHIPAREVILNGRHAIQLAEEKSNEKALLYFHGGGYHWGSPKTHKLMVSKICELAHVTGFLPYYSLAPEAPFPAALNDATAAYKGILDLGYAPENIVVGGDSAGGGLAMATMLCLQQEGVALPQAAVLLSPWLDLTHSGDSFESRAHLDPMLSPTGTRNWATSYAAGKSLEHPLVSPLFANLEGLPPLLVHVGENEILFDDARRLEQKARSQKVAITYKAWPQMIHVFQFFSSLVNDAEESLKEIGQFIRRQLN